MKKLVSKGAGLLNAIWGAIAARRAQHRDRDAFMQLVWQDDRIIADAGYKRDDVDWAAKLPIHINAAKALKAQTRGDKETTDRKVPSNQPSTRSAKRPTQKVPMIESRMDSATCLAN